MNGFTRDGENGIYVTFVQMPDQIHRDASSFGWDLKKLEEEGKFRLVLTSPNVLLDGGVEDLLGEAIKEVGAKWLVFDSLSHFAMFIAEDKLRLEAYRLICYVKAKGLSSLYLWEAPQLMGTSFSVTEVGMSFLVDSIVLLRTVEIESELRKGLVILKMRGSDHDKRLREYEITSNGINVRSMFSGYEGIMSGSARKVGRVSGEDLYRKGLIKK